MDLLAYFPAGMKAGDELSYPWSEQGLRLEKTLKVVAAENWHVSLKSKDFAFDVSTSRNVASTSAPSRIRAGVTLMASQDATGDVSTGKLIVSGGFEQKGKAIAIVETGYTAGQDPDQPGSSTLSLGGGFGDYADQTLVLQLVVQ